MSTDDSMTDFEIYLAHDFNATQVCSGLLNASNTDPDSKELDLMTAIKKVKYNLQEVERRSENVIKANPSHLIDNFDQRELVQSRTRESLGSSLEYLDMSYKRLDTEILEPYQQCLRLRSALSKIHQTSSILRDVSIYLHLVRQIANSSSLGKNDDTDLQSAVALASMHSQIQMELNSNPDLRALALVKKYESETIIPSRRDTLKYLSDRLLKESTLNTGNQSARQTVASLVSAIRDISQKEFISVIDKAVLNKIASSVQTLAKTITSIKNLPKSMEVVVHDAQTIYFLQDTLRDIKHDNLSLLNEYLSHKNYKSLTEMFWIRTSKNFKRDFDISFNRGGPVGKSLIANSSFITKSISGAFEGTDNAKDISASGLERMLDAVSILNIHAAK